MGPTVVKNGWIQMWVEELSSMRQVGHPIAWAEATSRDLMLGSQGWVIPRIELSQSLTSHDFSRHVSPSFSDPELG